MANVGRRSITSISLILLLLLMLANSLSDGKSTNLNSELVKFSTSDPTIVNISVMDGTNSWRELTDNTWIPASHCQTFRVIARDDPIAPESLTLNYWVEKDHDTNLDRIANSGEYAQVTLVRQTASNESIYSIDNQGADCISDISNQGIQNRPLVSLFVSAPDGSGGSDGFSNDLVTYQAMESSQPSVTSLHIQDDFGINLTSTKTTMYAGQTYHLRVQGGDQNGWADIAEVRINLNPLIAGDMVIHYTPSNDTAWTDSDWIDVLDLVEDGQGAEMRRLDGGVLIDPFETQFILDIPIVFDWSVTTLNGVRTPVVEVTDFDPNNGGWTTTSGGAGNYVQKVSYLGTVPAIGVQCGDVTLGAAGQMTIKWIYEDESLLNEVEDRPVVYVDDVYDHLLHVSDKETTITGTHGTSYKVEVKLMNGVGTNPMFCSHASITADGRVDPTPIVSGMTATVLDTDITLNWNAEDVIDVDHWMVCWSVGFDFAASDFAGLTCEEMTDASTSVTLSKQTVCAGTCAGEYFFAAAGVDANGNKGSDAAQAKVDLSEGTVEPESDRDGDTVTDSLDAFPDNADEWADSDGDGVGDNADAFPDNANESADSDGDGVGDNADAFPDDANESADSDGDGVGDNSDVFPNNSNESIDSDNDGIGDNGDTFPNNPDESSDSDGDGIGDNQQAAMEAANRRYILIGIVAAIFLILVPALYLNLRPDKKTSDNLGHIIEQDLGIVTSLSGPPPTVSGDYNPSDGLFWSEWPVGSGIWYYRSTQNETWIAFSK